MRFAIRAIVDEVCTVTSDLEDSTSEMLGASIGARCAHWLLPKYDGTGQAGFLGTTNMEHGMDSPSGSSGSLGMRMSPECTACSETPGGTFFSTSQRLVPAFQWNAGTLSRSLIIVSAKYHQLLRVVTSTTLYEVVSVRVILLAVVIQTVDGSLNLIECVRSQLISRVTLGENASHLLNKGG